MLYRELKQGVGESDRVGVRGGYFSQDSEGRLSEEVTVDLPCAVMIYLG